MKLIRDYIPEIMKSLGKIPKVRELSESEFKRAIIQKLVEEVQELQHALNDYELFPTSAVLDEVIYEVGDIRDVLDQIMKLYGISEELLEEARERKNAHNGSFEKRLYLE